MKRFWQQLGKISETLTVQKRQMTLTQDYHLEPSSPHLEVIMVQNKDTETVLQESSMLVVEDASVDNMLVNPSAVLKVDTTPGANEDNDDGFMQPKKSVPFVAFSESYNNIFASISASAAGRNSFAAMA